MIRLKEAAMVLIILIQTSLLCAQRNRLQIGIGYQRTWMVDQQVSPLKYQTSETTFSLNFQHKSNTGKIIAGIDGAIGKLFPTGYQGRLMYNPGYYTTGQPIRDSSLMIGKIYQGRLKLGYLAALGNGFSRIGKNDIYTGDYLGGSINNQLFYSDNIVRNGWLNSTSINADYEHDISFNAKHFINIKLSIPLFARNSRLPYHNSISSEKGEGAIKTFFKQGSRLTWLADFQNIQVDATYEYAIGNHTGIGLHYSGQWFRYSHERPVTLFQNNIGVIATVK